MCVPHLNTREAYKDLKYCWRREHLAPLLLPRNSSLIMPRGVNQNTAASLKCQLLAAWLKNVIARKHHSFNEISAINNAKIVPPSQHKLEMLLLLIKFKKFTEIMFYS